MATGTGKHKLLSTGPTEPWSIREKLCLASSVMRSGDQNWLECSGAIWAHCSLLTSWAQGILLPQLPK
ncbi:BRD8 isoform 12 [Pan troglodytes]|uniref:Bromodomain containing 8 n=4 Tax=Homininae TaxID=207598 RepID=F8WCS7_HUMAN|nr:bromodomain containing 8 [Homo sapiens]KAI4022802.1 bromodomain containing 8 [Homo sapiens]PNI49830.1 BRD8 isoform 12 [Pan troglodytes]